MLRFKKLFETIIIIFITLFLVELGSFAYFSFFATVYYRPAYLRKNAEFSWRTDYEAWGSWHKKNATTRHVSPCFDVTYTSNSIGARDVERGVTPNNSIIFLGDSFIEGFGIIAEDRLSNKVEQKTGRAAINLSSAGSLGPLQYLMLYNRFADLFSHNTVVIGFLPYNDFTDNDPSCEEWQKDNFRYRPYYIKSDTGYDVFYKGTCQVGRTFKDFSADDFLRIRNILDYTWTGGFYRMLAGGNPLPPKSIDVSFDISKTGYFETSVERIDAAYYFLNKIADDAKKRAAKVYLLIIPSYSEAKELRKRSSPWINEFSEKFRKNNVEVIDLGPFFSKLSDSELRACFLDCDGHWSENGNALATDVLLKAFSTHLNTEERVVVDR